MHVPLDVRDPNALAVLAMIVCLTPGTAWAELSLDRSMLLLHVFDLDDAAAIHRRHQERYERPLMEIFESDPCACRGPCPWRCCCSRWPWSAPWCACSGPVGAGPRAGARLPVHQRHADHAGAGHLYASSDYFEAALLIALFGFVGSTAMAKFLLRGEVIE